MDLSPFDALKPLAGRALEAALNQAIALDPDTSAALRPLEGRRIQLVVDAPPLAMDIMVGGGRLQVGPASEVLEADLAGEYDARTAYKKSREICHEAGDYVTMALFEALLTDEEGHIDFLETQLDLLNKIGVERYGQLNAESADSAE